MSSRSRPAGPTGEKRTKDSRPVPPDPCRRGCAAGGGGRGNAPARGLGGGGSPPEAVVAAGMMERGGAESWSAGALRPRDDMNFGRFRLAYLEALLGAADCRA